MDKNIARKLERSISSRPIRPPPRFIFTPLSFDNDRAMTFPTANRRRPTSAATQIRRSRRSYQRRKRSRSLSMRARIAPLLSSRAIFSPQINRTYTMLHSRTACSIAGDLQSITGDQSQRQWAPRCYNVSLLRSCCDRKQRRPEDNRIYGLPSPSSTIRKHSREGYSTILGLVGTSIATGSA